MSDSLAIAVFGPSLTQPGDRLWEEAEQLGARIAGEGMAVITGGYGGVMEAASRGASLVEGHVIGVTAPAVFRNRSGANRYVTELVEADSLSHRIGVMISRARGAVVLPGPSLGTATELVFVWNHNHIVRRHGGARFPVAAVGPVWEALADTLIGRVGADAGDVQLAGTAIEALDWLISQPEIR